jgi:hypothetical protein
MIIRKYTTYNADTGEIVTSFTGDEANTQANTPTGCLLVIGEYSSLSGYFNSGVFVEYTDAQKSAKRTRPKYLASWDNATMRWVDSRTSAEIETDALTKRGTLLAESDWTTLSDVPLSPQQKTDWAAYRQALRDITVQSGFPQDIQWPVAPAS